METLCDQYPVEALAEALEVSPSGFVAHEQKPQRPRHRQDAQLCALIGQSFAQARQTGGRRGGGE
jgi:hypothetical protein